MAEDRANIVAPHSGGHDGTRVVPRDDVVLGRPIQANGADLDLGPLDVLGYQPGKERGPKPGF